MRALFRAAGIKSETYGSQLTTGERAKSGLIRPEVAFPLAKLVGANPVWVQTGEGDPKLVPAQPAPEAPEAPDDARADAAHAPRRSPQGQAIEMLKALHAREKDPVIAAVIAGLEHESSLGCDEWPVRRWLERARELEDELRGYAAARKSG